MDLSGISLIQTEESELEETSQKRKETVLMDQESKYDNTGNSYPVPSSEPDTSLH